MSDDSDSPLRCISAVTLGTRNMGRSVLFYDRLGFELRYGGAAASFTSYAVGAAALNLIAASANEPWPWWGRIIFYVADVDTFHARALAQGLAPDTPPADGDWGERYFHITDPDGHELSFATPLPGKAARPCP